jgi:hypothetical protein
MSYGPTGSSRLSNFQPSAVCRDRVFHRSSHIFFPVLIHLLTQVRRGIASGQDSGRVLTRTPTLRV